jgi:hypothetical protein
MAWPDDYVLYSINVEDVREVAREEGLREFTDDEIKAISERLGDYIDWYDAILLAIQDVAPDAMTGAGE